MKIVVTLNGYYSYTINNATEEKYIALCKTSLSKAKKEISERVNHTEQIKPNGEHHYSIHSNGMVDYTLIIDYVNDETNIEY